MPDTPLNPDAIFTAGDVIHENFGVTRKIDHLACTAIAERAVSAYLAVAQPEVNSEEELDALPAGTLVKSGGREFYKTSYIDLPWILPYGVDRFGSSYLAKHSKVTVIHRPEVKP